MFKVAPGEAVTAGPAPIVMASNTSIARLCTALMQSRSAPHARRAASRFLAAGSTAFAPMDDTAAVYAAALRSSCAERASSLQIWISSGVVADLQEKLAALVWIAGKGTRQQIK